tara:strand:+ start:788 stop:1120 length:333 start_codon:yes stop_codon:yes gene_type:complete
MADKDDAMDIAKAAIEEAKALKEELQLVKMERDELRKAIEDPTEVMKSQGWMQYITPHAEEAFDPLNRNASDEQSFSGPFQGSGDLITKGARSRFEEIREWEEAERMMRE